MLRTHTCGELRTEHIGQHVTLSGWVNRRRDMGGVIFIDLRDRYGKTQIVVDTGESAESAAIAEQIRPEYVVQVTGTVSARLPGQENPNMDTGDIELKVNDLTILNASKTPPMLIDRDGGEDETLRLKYRYLDLRKERMQRNLRIRHKAIKYIRDYLDNNEFLEVETPILFKSTPEGARDYLVPSRVHPGKFYALPQSPQQLKQLLMVGGYDRYFQIARCFRDEDQRADRQPEFTQLDVEMSFVERDDILDLIEDLVRGMVNATSTVPLAYEQFPRISYTEAVEKYGSDRPDLRYDLPLVDVSDIAGQSAFGVFANNVAAGNPVKALVVPGCGDYSRKQISELEELAKVNGAKGLAWLAIDPENEQIKGFIAKFFTVQQLIALTERLNAGPGDLILFSSDTRLVVRAVLGALRDEMATRLGYKDTNTLAFAWVIDFPLFEEEKEGDHYAPSHHMFTSPMPGDIPLLKTDPHAVKAAQYDLICNGYEVGGGSIRIHNRQLQRQIMELIGFSLAEAETQFGHMLEAFEYGAPPHGGIALGIDRLMALMAGEPNIREVMAFPKNQNATDVMADAPSAVVQRQLDDLHIALAGKALERVKSS
ncbi:MAG: aspartate--tRNA ligase [Anaerolineae bacterium]|nr:aspartate--tRNA ligase [Anaerolineae bacterium]MCO5190622.1 aspartate--tRNA ligase [Anaerolineae bacterium]